VPWGRHVGLFYETKQDLLEICRPFLQAGLESNEGCVWVIAAPLTEQEAWAALRDAVPIEILRSQTWHFTGDSPDLQKVARGWEDRLADALRRGHEGLRVAASAPRLDAKDWAPTSSTTRRG